MMSVDIGVSEDGTDADWMSLQLTGFGQVYGDFTWQPPNGVSFNAINPGQSF
jgi:hypothetical protein